MMARADNEFSIDKVRHADEIEAIREMVWEFFDVIRHRYPDMLETIDRYVEEQDIAGELASFERFFLPPAGECLIARLGGEPVGMIMLKPLPDKAAELNRMYVREQARGLGIGRALCQNLIAEAKALGYREILLDALYRHVEALPLYASLGFEHHVSPHAFDASDDRVIHMRLSLD